MICPACGFRFAHDDWPEACPRCHRLREFAERKREADVKRAAEWAWLLDEAGIAGQKAA